MEVAGDERIVAEARIAQHVGHHYGLPLGDDILAEAYLAWRFGCVEPVGRFEPLAAIVDERYQRDRHAVQVGDHLGHAIERRFGRRIHDAIFAKRFEAQPFGPFCLFAAPVRQFPSPAAMRCRPIAIFPGPPLCHRYGPYKSILAAQQESGGIPPTYTAALWRPG